MSLVLWGTFIALMLARVPIVFAMGLAGGLALLTGGVPMTLLVQRMLAQIDSFALLAVPFFILTGSVMGAGGISARLVRFAGALVGRYRGGLGATCITTTTIFSGISGSSASDAAAIGSILIPAMIRRGYGRAYAAALQAAAAVNGPIIPPSVLMIVYASIANVSVGAMFVGGAIPGLIIAAALLTGNWWWARRNNLPAEAPASLREVGRATVDAGWALVVPVIILGGILSGVFTATEAGAVAAALIRAGRDREQGLVPRLRPAPGAPLDDTLVRQGRLSFADGQRHLADLLDAKRRPTAVFCAGNDVIALGAYYAALRGGVAVPGELSLVGFDDIQMSGWAAFEPTYRPPGPASHGRHRGRPAARAPDRSADRASASGAAGGAGAPRHARARGARRTGPEPTLEIRTRRPPPSNATGAQPGRRRARGP